MNSLRYYTEKLVSINSVTESEERIANYIEAELKNIGLKPRRYGNNLVVGKGSAMLVGHSDTVPLVDNSQLKPVYKNGKIWGRGACDMKSGLAVMLELAKTEETQFVFYTGEEGPLPNGLNHLLNKKLLKAELAVALEPTGLKLYTGNRGRMLAKVVTKGKAQHPSLAQKPANAIEKAVEIIQTVKNARKTLQRNGETMNVTKIKTENATNVIPDACTLYIDYRFSPFRTNTEVKHTLKKVTDLSFSTKDASPGYVLDKKTTAIFARTLGKPLIFPAWSDSAQLSLAGIPCTIYGPGNLEVAHSANEYVSLKQMQTAYTKLKKFLRNL